MKPLRLALTCALLLAADARGQTNPIRRHATEFAGCFDGIGCLRETYTTILQGPFGIPGASGYSLFWGYTLEADFTSPHTAVMAPYRDEDFFGCGGPGPIGEPSPPSFFSCTSAFFAGPVFLQSFWHFLDELPPDLPVPPGVLDHGRLGPTRQAYVYTPIPGVEIVPGPDGRVDVREFATQQVVTLRNTTTPEPASLALVTGGVLALGGLARARA